MSHAVRRVTTSAAPSGEALPTTATVLDYNCLFTHDLKRKQKRWQDGKLKYHTFNKKIMVYDDRGNFIGDAHWHAGGPLEEDEELDLDRGAAIVQVADYIGSREQDLTEVLDKRAREVEKRRATAAAKTPAPGRVRAGPAAGTAAESTPVRMIHRPLSSIVPSPASGPLGRASIPSRSPYEARKADGLGEPRGEAPPPPPPPPPARKRRRSPSPPSKAGFARSLFGAALSLSSSAGGSANRTAWAALRERGVNAHALAVSSAETSDDDVVVLGERPRTKASSLHRSRRKAQTMDDEIVEQRSVETSGIHGSTDNTESRPFKRATHILRGERQPTPASDKSSEKNETNKPPRRTAMAHQEKHGKTTSKSAASDPPDSAPPKPQERRTELRIRSRKRRGLLVVAEKRQGQQAPQSSIAAELSEQNINGASAVAGQKLPADLTKLDDYKSKATPEHTSESTMAPEAGFGGDSASHYLAPSPYDQPEDADRLSSDSTPGDVVATDKPSEPPEEMADDVTECLKASDSIEVEDSRTHISLDSDTTSTARPKAEEVEAGASQRAYEERPELPDIVEAQASRGSAISEVPPASISTDEESDLPPVEAQESRRSNKSEVPPANMSTDEESDDFPPARKSTWRRKRVEPPPPSEEMTALHNSEVMPANMSTDEESEDFSLARKTKRPRKKAEPPPSSEEMPAQLAPARRRSARMKRNSQADTALGHSSGESDCEKSRERRPSAQTDGLLEADTAGNSSEDEVSDCASRKRPPKRRQPKKDCELTGAHQTAIPAGPRIKRLARKSVKSKEIFGFIPSLETGQTAPSPFAMTATRIGVVGRPPTALTRLPGISLTIKPPGLCGRDSGSNDKHADTVQEPISGGQHGQDEVAAERGPDDVDAVAMAARPVAAAASASASALDQAPAGLLASTENVVSNRGLPPRAKIANPATRGKKAARKTDAAGQAPQHVVPFEPPQPVRPVPKAKPPGPSGPSAARDAPSLPGFSTAKGGAWSAHAEDLLGMTRPTGKRT
ncbi:hypothetical protein E4U43_001609 [Claviceps pusilla]|uniref:5'-3' DNA helicase ZGRF1-like N-terminal domain-containing protein n=1 Tax=Claviceps pusilla TaxID=123648 RepID=A0A9P7N9V5_9HYPO|nr:hypothetical protein E4U43_001609 [Claviceps pusilla]